MRIIKRQDLMTLPAGTLYTLLSVPWAFSGMSIKGDTINIQGRNIDFGERTIEWVDGNNSDESTQRLEMMLENSTCSYLVEKDYGREGMFDDEQNYMIYEQADIESILEDLKGAYNLADLNKESI